MESDGQSGRWKIGMSAERMEQDMSTFCARWMDGVLAGEVVWNGAILPSPIRACSPSSLEHDLLQQFSIVNLGGSGVMDD